MAFSPRLLAPVAAPPPPKPPQLNIVASAIMPDVETDTFGPGDGPSLVAGAGYDSTIDPNSGRRMFHRLPGDETYRKAAEKHNALVAAGMVESMGDVVAEQMEEDPASDGYHLPESVFAATADSRWTGGFAFAPENQFRGLLNDWAGQSSDIPYMTGNGAAAPAGGASTPSITGGTLTAAASPYSYVLAAIFEDGSIGNASAAIAATISSGVAGSVALNWTAPAAPAAGVAIFGRFATAYRLLGTVAIGTTTFTDTGASSPTLVGSLPPLGNTPVVGFIPYLIQVRDKMSAFGWKQRDFVGRALRLLDFATPNAIERELWSGAFAQAGFGGAVYQSDFPQGFNAFFTQSGTPSSGGTLLVPQDLTPTPASPPSVTRGIQILEDYLANTGGGGQGMLHVAPETSPNLLGARRVGALLLSVMDNIIVPGSGYPTSGAQGPIGNAHATASSTTAWLFATDLIQVRLDAPYVYPSTLAEAMDRVVGSTGGTGEPDTITFRAQRFASATWDGARLAACLVTLAT
jgi:hypothetical protein